MNKKGKNKKGKVPNPSPSQSEKLSENINLGVISDDGNSEKTSEIIEIVEEKNESVKEDRVPAIVSDIDIPPIELKDEQSPKKPKRNKSKKKKDKDSEIGENISVEPNESAKEVTSEDTNKDTLEIEPLEKPSIAPTTRKKKNKKKNLEQNPGQPISAEFMPTELPTEIIDAAKDIEVKEIKPEMSSLPETEEESAKLSKKKNKKKNLEQKHEQSISGEYMPTELPTETIEAVKDIEVKEIKPEISSLSETEEESAKLSKTKNKQKNLEKKHEQSITAEFMPTELPTETIDAAKEIEVKEMKPEISSLPGTEEESAKQSKKKNKKKNLEQKPKQFISAEFMPTELPTETIDAAKEIEVKEMKPEISSLPETEEQVVKLSKKKNKKKQRTDSEKSEKEDVSCTTAFQNLIEAIDDTLEIEVEKKVEDNTIPIKSTKSEIEVLPETITLPKERASDKNSECQEEQISPIGQDSQPMEEKGKGKKKNKKDKKHISQSEDTKSNENISTISTLPSDTVSKEQITGDILEKNECITEQDVGSKHKAKIIKPVEKKRDICQDSQSAEILQSKEPLNKDVLESMPMMESDNKIIFKVEDKSIHQELHKGDNMPTPESLQLSIEMFEPLNIPDKPMGKKRKKESKMPKTPDVSFEILENKDEVITKLDSETVDLPKVSGTSTTPIPEKNIISEVAVTEDTQKPIKLNVEIAPQSGIKEHILLTPESLEEENTTKSGKVTPVSDEQKPESKSAKKLKKSPKPHKKLNKPQKDLETTAQSAMPSETLDVSKEIESSNITKMYDIEISSIKAENAEGTECDTIPNVTYPRSVSENVMDANNNSTVIAEILPSQSSVSDIQKKEHIETPKTVCKSKNMTSPLKEEKTDLKSKMMEVNQDMEELRLSIERSLAELTAIEKSEVATEKEHEESKPKLKKDLKTDQPERKINEDDYSKICKKPNVDIIAVESSNIALPTPLLPFDCEQPKLTDTLQSTTIITPDVIGGTTDSRDKEIPTEQLKNTLPIPETAIDSVIYDVIDSTNILTVKETLNEEVLPALMAPFMSPDVQQESETKDLEKKLEKEELTSDTPPICPARKDHKNKHKKKKGKQDLQVPSQSASSSTSSQSAPTTTSTTTTQEAKKEEKNDSKKGNKSDSKDSKQKGKQQSSVSAPETEKGVFTDVDYEPIENFEDALTSSVDDVNKTFELIVNESQEDVNPKISISTPDEVKTTVTPPKNLLGHPDIPVSSNKRDYKKEKDKIPNEITATVKIRDSIDVERKVSKNTQTTNKLKDLSNCKLSDNEEFVYKYNFRQVFLQSACQVCKKNLGATRLPCCYCNLVFYCGAKHKDEDWPLHQALCFAVSTIGHLKDQKHIYADTKNITGLDYRLVRMQMIVSCEKILKRRLVPWEQEALLYPRVCAHVPCREWRQTKLTDCQGCGQISYCTANEDHYPKSHSRWCKSYSLYQKLVSYQQSKGRLEPKLPTKVMQENFVIPENMNEVLAAMYEEKIDMNDIQYAALTQLATAPLTAAYCHQLCCANSITNGCKKAIFTIHVVGAELQFEADALNKWEVFFLHLRPDLQELRVVLINSNLNPSNLPLDLLGKIKLCEQCRQDKRKVVLRFQDKRTYADYKRSEDFIVPDIVCAFNPSIQRSSVYNGKDPWPSAINVILKQKIPLIITGYTLTELRKDCIRIKECSDTEFKFISEPKMNSFASVRPDRNFITDDEMPLLFKNYCYTIICG